MCVCVCARARARVCTEERIYTTHSFLFYYLQIFLEFLCILTL